MSKQKVAVVTGGNKGIGYAIVKGLCEKYDGLVYLTARDAGRGEETVKTLKEKGLNPSFHQLDIDDDGSVAKFKDYISKTYGGIDVLVNNAGIAYKQNATEPFGEQAKGTVKTNYFGTLRVCEALFPLLRPNATVINVSSCCGHLSKIPSEELRKQLCNPALTVSELSELMNDFVKSAQENTNSEKGWGNSAYNASKVGVSALTRIQQRDLDNEETNRNIFVNSVHPGYVDTDMTSHTGILTIEEGAVGPLYLALQPHGLKGKYVWKDCSLVDWEAQELPEPPY